VWLEGLLRGMGVHTPAQDVLAVLRERSGLIVGPGVYSFAHKSIGEFLVAETILEGDRWDDAGRRMDRFRLFENRDNDRWNTVTFLWAGLAPVADVELFVNECIDAGSWDLAGGILYDQYERIPVDLRRALLLKLLSPIYTRDMESLHEDDSFWVPSGPARPDLEYVLPSAVYSDLVQGKTVAINFIFTTCTTICPPLGATFARVQRELGERAGRDVHLISVSVDPANDTPERLKAWGAKFKAAPGWTFVTGAKPEIDELLRALAASTARPEDHSPTVLVINDQKGLVTRTYGLARPSQIMKVIDDAIAGVVANAPAKP